MCGLREELLPDWLKHLCKDSLHHRLLDILKRIDYSMRALRDGVVP